MSRSSLPSGALTDDHHALDEMSSPSPSRDRTDSPVMEDDARSEDQRTQSSLHYSLLGPSLLKAGQDGVDQSKISEIIYNASKGSKFFKHEEKRDEQLTHRIETILQRKRELEGESTLNEVRKVDERVCAKYS
jgi:DNA polymerase kappa